MLRKISDSRTMRIARWALVSWFVLANAPQVLWDNLSNRSSSIIEVTNCSTDKILLKPNNNFSNISELVISIIETNYKGCFSSENLEILKYILGSDIFQKWLDTLSIEKEWNLYNVTKAIIFAFIYFLSYIPTLTSLWKREIKIRKKSFAWFATASWWAAFITWIVPWAIVLAETFMLASIALVLDTKNTHWSMLALAWNTIYNAKFWDLPSDFIKIWDDSIWDDNEERYKPYSYDTKAEEREKEYKILRFMANNLSKVWVCFSKFDETWKPIIWNDALAKISWYSYKEILDSWEKAPQSEKKIAIMKLLYKWDDYIKVREYLDNVNKTWWYDNIMFTMTTKSWNRVNLLWTTMPDTTWWTSRMAILENADDEAVRELFDDFPYPVSKYDKKWKPIVWNKALEETTWYSREEVLETWEKAPEWEREVAIMKLLYKWDNYNKVKSFVDNVDTTWWYTEAFTMNRKDWTEVTLLWTTIPDWKWWTIRTAKELTDPIEIKKELERTKTKLEESERRNQLLEEQKRLLQDKANKDEPTWLLNKSWLKEFINWYNRNLYSLVFLDLDFLKKANDGVSHEFWDIVIRMFWFYLKNFLRESDISVRYWWDEFIAFLDFCKLENSLIIINDFRELLSSTIFYINSNWEISITYIWNNTKHEKVFSDFINIAKINIIYDIDFNILKTIKPWEPKLYNWWKLISFSASCWLKQWNKADDIYENIKHWDNLAYFVKKISVFLNSIDNFNKFKSFKGDLIDKIKILLSIKEWDKDYNDEETFNLLLNSWYLTKDMKDKYESHNSDYKSLISQVIVDLESIEYFYEELENWFIAFKRKINDDIDTLVVINKGWYISIWDSRNGSSHYIYDNEWNIDWIEIIKWERILKFTKSWYEFYDIIRKIDTNAWNRD